MVTTSEQQSVTIAHQSITGPTAEPIGQAGGAEWQTQADTLRVRAARFWLNLLFWSTAHLPAVVRLTVPFWVWATWLSAAQLRQRMLANARRLLGEQSSPRSRRQLARQVIRSFYHFVYDVGRHAPMSLDAISKDIREVHGQSHFHAARKARRGMILATAHMGSFEVGIAALRQLESDVTVVFQRDRLGLFEQLRTQLRQSLGVREVAVDDGLGSWATLKDVLSRGEVVLMQADRVMPGQKGAKVPFVNGHIDMPIGVAKLAALSGAPIVPVFTERHDDGSVSVFIEPAIEPPTTAEFYANRGGVPQAMKQLAAVIESHVKARPHQWLMLRRAWCEDSEH